MSVQMRVATFNASLNRPTEGELIADLSMPDDAQARSIAEIIQKADADVVLINEFDYDAAGEAAALFQANYLSVAQNAAIPINYPYVYAAPSNTGILSGFDLNNDGVTATEADRGGFDYAEDSRGFGQFPGQYGFVIFSKHPIDTDNIRTFQNFLWKDMPDALLTNDPTDDKLSDFYAPEEIATLRLSSKNHVDLPVMVDGEVVHVLASHPTPPVFDGPEDYNGKRNADEIRLWADYVEGADYIYDDAGRTRGLTSSERFVILGDQNADPFDGDSFGGAIDQLLDNLLIQGSATDPAITPQGPGGTEQAVAQGGANADNLGDPAFDTADFGFNSADPASDLPPGNLRVDYVLPSQTGFVYLGGAVFWPESADPDLPLTSFPTSDHRLVSVDLALTDQDRVTVAPIEVGASGEGDYFLGVVEIQSFTEVDGTVLGGLSGLSYDPLTGLYRAILDDRVGSRLYELSIDLSDAALDAGDVTVFDAVALTSNGAPLDVLAPDPEGIALGGPDTLYVSSERDLVGNPAIYRFDLAGALKGALPVDTKFAPNAAGTNGVRSNLGFESLTVTPDRKALYTATESALVQDGPPASLALSSAARIIRYDLATGLPVAEYVYEVDPIAAESDPADAFADSGLVELIALDNQGTLLALERSFSTGGQDRGFTGKLYLARTQGATNVIDQPSIPTGEDDGELAINVDSVVQKELLLDLGDLGIAIDNIEGMALGPVLEDGRQSLIIVSDDNFSDFGPQATQFIALGLDLGSVPTIAPIVETPDDLRYDNAFDTIEGADPDDPAVWVNRKDAGESIVITAMKDDGLRVFDLEGNLLQRIEPEGIRYNNVDVLYGVKIGDRTLDLAVASDRENDTLAIFRIRKDGTLRDVTSSKVPDTIFGVDDGEATAYGLAAYTSPVDGKSYVFVTQASGASIAQLELTARGNRVSFEKVRELTLPVPAGEDTEDFQSEGITIDRETGKGYVAVEGELGLLSFEAELGGSNAFEVVAPIDSEFFAADLEGVSIHYGENGAGLIVVSSQGDSTFAVFDRASEAYLGSFAIRDEGGIDGVEESDGLEIYSGALPGFEDGLLITQDGSNEVQVVFGDPEDGEIQNFNVNFKYTDLGEVLALFGAAANPDFDPRNVTPNTLPNGAASGDVTENSVVLWTRSLAPGRVTFEVYALDAGGTETLDATAYADVTDPDQPVKVTIEGLSPDADYRYVVTDAASDTASGAFGTAAAAGEHVGLTFGVSGDWRGELATYPAIANAPDADLDFFVAHGDTIYADFASPFVPKSQAETLDEFRAKHDEVYSARGEGTGWSELRESTPFFATIDDHEVTNDFAGGAPTAGDPRFGETEGLQNDAQVYEDGLEAFQEYNPLRDEFYGATGDDRTAGERKLYRAQSFGDDAAMFVLDQRSFRDAQLAGPDLTDPADIGRFQAESFDPDRTLLGAAQLADLKADLLAADAAGVTWKFVYTPEPIQNLGFFSADAWEGYAAERSELLGFIEANAIDNVVFVAADIHATFVNNLTYQENPLGPQLASSAFEITTGSVAFDPPFGPAAVGVGAALGLLTPEQVAAYATLPIAPDADDLPNDRDDFVKATLNQLLAQGGFDPIGLNANLAAAEGLIDAELLQGDYVAANTFGWTEFEIDKTTQELTATTYGIPGYTPEEAAADPDAIRALTPEIVSQFTVAPQGLPGLDIEVLARFQGDSDPTNADSPLGASEVVASEDGKLYVTNGNLGRIDIFPLVAETHASMLQGANGYGADPILTIGETIGSSGALNALNDAQGGYAPVGVLDGLGAFALDAETVRVFANHELQASVGSAYAVSDGAGGSFEMTGARISYFDIDKETRQIVDGGLAYDTIYDATGTVASDTSFLQEGLGGLSRLCSGNLIESEQFGDGRGLADRVYFAGEEDGGTFNPVGGAEWALNPETGALWQAPALGRGAWENVTEIDTGTTNKVAFILADDTSPFDVDGDGVDEAAPLYLYAGEKNPDGDFLERNGLADGTLHVWVADTGETLPSDLNGPGSSLAGSWIAIDNASQPALASEDGSTGYDEFGYPTQGNLWLQAKAVGAFGFSRPEDVATNPADGAEFTLASTGVDTYDIDPASGNGADTFGDVYTMKVDFADIANPAGALKILYDGDADAARALRSPDNLDWADDRRIYVQEDKAEEDTAAGDEVLFGEGAANPAEAGIVRIDPETGSTYRVANMDRSVVLDPNTTGEAVDLDAGIAGEWESSGIVDVSTLFDEVPGTLFLYDVQAHGIADQDAVNPDSRITDDDLVEGGQLGFLSAPDPIDLTGIPGFDGVQSVAVANGLIAAAIRIESREVAIPPVLGGTAVLPSNGVVAFFDAETLALVRTVEVGNLPDQLTFSADGATLLAANEGEFNADSETTQDPAGSVSIIAVDQDFAVTTIDFAALEGFEEVARAAGVRVAPGRSLALDLEPEYIAIDPYGTKAYVTLQESNAVAVIDLEASTLLDLLPLGVIDHSQPGNEIDADDNGVIELRSFDDLVGLRMPDAITAFAIGGATYFATANEGDGRGDAPEFDEARVEDLAPGAIDPSVDTAGLERLTISTVDGDTDGDGDIDVLHAFGARSFTIFDTDGQVMFDSGAELAELIAQVAPERFQDDEGEPDENRSDAKGVEPEAIEVGEIDGEHFAFIGLERDSGIAVYNISTPADAFLVDYISGFGTSDLGPEVLEFVAAGDSPTGEALLLASYEVSGTTVAYELTRGMAEPDPLAFV